MRLVRHVSLGFREGTSDKVYEVDLCDLGDGRFVVNFRYGRRGSNLREGTKTAEPTDEASAARIFEDLVASKVHRGYREVEEGAELGEAVAPPTTPETSRTPTDPRSRKIIEHLEEGHRRGLRWQLSRAAWRAAELGIKQAEPALIALVGTGNDTLEYSLVWALARCGSEACVPALRTAYASKQNSEAVRRMARVALLERCSGPEREELLRGVEGELPPSLAGVVRTGPAASVREALNELLEVPESAPSLASTLQLAYLIDGPHVRPALIEALRSPALGPETTPSLKFIYKVAELRRDAEVLGVVAQRLENDAGVVRSPRTRCYLRRRTWRTLRRLGELGDDTYVPLAVGVLLGYGDVDGQEPWTSWAIDPATGDSVARLHDRFAPFWALNHIIRGESERFEPVAKSARFRLAPGSRPGQPAPAEREEPFGKLWDARPDAVLRLLQESRCTPVHEFAVKVLRDADAFRRELELSVVLELLVSRFAVTVELAFEMARDRYDPIRPDARLLLGVATANHDDVREQGFAWIREQRTLLERESDLVAGLVCSEFDDARAFAREMLNTVTIGDAERRLVVGKVIARLQGAGEDQGEWVDDVRELVVLWFEGELGEIGVDVVRDLSAHRLAEVRQLAGEIILRHGELAKNPPIDVMQALLDDEAPEVSGLAARIIGGLPDAALKGNLDLLVALVRHPQPSVREGIGPGVVRLAQGDEAFGRRMAEALLAELLVPGAPEGVPGHTARFLIGDLRDFLAGVPRETVWELLQSRSGPAREVGGALLATNVPPSELSAEQIVKLADHEILSVREAAWALCRTELGRLRERPAVAIGLAESRWEDSRRFAFGYLRENFVDEDLLDVTTIIALCDSVRPDVQQFGREVITRVFQDEHGEEYVDKLSEHPTESMQLFASNFLERHATNDPARLRAMAPYFLAVLARVNRGRVARQRSLRFLGREALKSREAAVVVGEILARHSATVAIGDRARAIEIMLDIHLVYPDVELPITVRPVEVRGGV